MMSVKALLGVRQTTANDISLLEIGLPPLKRWVKQKQLNFLKEASHHREGLDDDPLTFAISLSTAAKTPMRLYITRLLDKVEYKQSSTIGLRKAVRTWTKSKLLAYKAMEPDLNVHKVYGQTDPVVPPG